MDVNNLNRIDLLKVGATSKNCLKFFPLGKSKKNLQKFIVGDYDGAVQCYNIKRGYCQNIFKLPTLKNSVKSVEIFKDKAFIASGSTIKVVTKKGKDHQKVQTSMTTEDINSLTIDYPNVWIAGEYIMYQYSENTEKAFFMSPDRINCMVCDNISGVETNAIIGCQDRVIRIIEGSNNIIEVLTQAPVSAMCKYNSNAVGDIKSHKSPSLIYGTSNGSLNMLRFDGGEKVAKLWDISGKNGVQIINRCDFTSDGIDDVLVGRDDGTVQIYSFDVSPVPSKVFERNINESITGIETGNLTSFHCKDMLISTFSGKILAYSPDNQVCEDQSLLKHSALKQKLESGIADVLKLGPKVVGISNENRIVSLRKEITALEEKVKQSREKYQSMSAEMIAVSCKYNLKHCFDLDTENACYRLSIELDVQIDMIAMRSTVPIDIIDVETSGVVVSLCTLDPKKDGGQMKATLRCSESSKRVDTLLRTVEGRYGELEVFIIPKLTPKTSSVIVFPIKPLSLHQRIYQSENINKTNFNSLTMSGSFSFSQMHGWIALCLDGIPEKVQDEEVNCVFRSTFQDTHLIIKCKKGEASFLSDNATTISVLQEVISKHATDQKIRINISYNINDESFEQVLNLLHPKLQYQLSLNEKVEIMEALKEIQLQEENLDFMDEQYKEVVQNAKQLQAEFEGQSKRLQFLYNIILRLYEDKYKFKRQNAQHQIKALNDLLNSREFSVQMLIKMFKQ